jgi:hypothetical protein
LESKWNDLEQVTLAKDQFESESKGKKEIAGKDIKCHNKLR